MNAIFSATFRMIPQNTRETILAHLTAVPHASPETLHPFTVLNSLCLFHQEWRFHHRLHLTSLTSCPQPKKLGNLKDCICSQKPKFDKLR